MKNVLYKAFATPSVNKRELALRLKMPEGTPLSPLEKCIEEVAAASSCKAVCTTVPVSAEGEKVSLGSLKCVSRSLAKNLSGCREAYVLAVTLGASVDMLLRRKSATSPSEHFICDAVASALCESLCDEAEGFFCKEGNLRPRFSPGYGDLSLEVQSEALAMCDAEKLLGIRLTDTLLMIPTKSITAIIGKCD